MKLQYSDFLFDIQVQHGLQTFISFTQTLQTVNLPRTHFCSLDQTVPCSVKVKPNKIKPSSYAFLEEHFLSIYSPLWCRQFLCLIQVGYLGYLCNHHVALEWQPIKFVCEFKICMSYNNITIKKSHIAYSPMLKSPIVHKSPIAKSQKNSNTDDACLWSVNFITR